MKLPELPAAFLTRPIAHRGYHDASAGIIENSRSAFDAAIEHGFGIELDLQLSSDGEAMVFHDYGLSRLTGQDGTVQMQTAATLTTTDLKGTQETIPTFGEILTRVNGRVPLLVELKDQDGALGNKVGKLEKRVADLLSEYPGPVALMSFNPHSVVALKTLCPDRARGHTTEDFTKGGHLINDQLKKTLSEIPYYDESGASFISHQWQDLDTPVVKRIRQKGGMVLCWTVKSADDELVALNFADNVTFEGYNPDAT